MPDTIDDLLIQRGELVQAIDVIDTELARRGVVPRSRLRIAPSPSLTGVDEIVRVVGRHFGVTHAAMISPDRSRSVANARHVAMYLARRRLHVSLPEIGRAFGQRDHTSSMHAVAKIARLTAEDVAMKCHVDAIVAVLDATPTCQDRQRNGLAMLQASEARPTNRRFDDGQTVPV